MVTIVATQLRGRAAQPVRPGFTLQDVLAGKLPLIADPKEHPEGEYITEACVTDLHKTYMTLVRRENEHREKARRLRGMTTDSFVKLMKFARLLGLIEFTGRTEEIDEELYFTFRRPKIGKVVLAKSVKRFYRLTDLGREEEAAWGNLCRAWRESWELPTGLPRLAVFPPEEEVEAPPPRPPVEEVIWKPIHLPEIPTKVQFRRLADHLVILSGYPLPEIVNEVDRIESAIGDFQVNIDDMVEAAVDRGDDVRAEELIHWYEELSNVLEDLYMVERGEIVRLTTAADRLRRI